MWKVISSTTAIPACPFCGAKASVTAEHMDERMGYAYCVRVQCTGCGAALSTTSKRNDAGWNNEPSEGVQARAEAMWTQRV